MINPGEKVDKVTQEEFTAMVMELPMLANATSERGVKRAFAISTFSFSTIAGLVITSYFTSGFFHDNLIGVFIALALCWFMPSITMIAMRTLLSIYATLVSTMSIQSILAIPSLDDIDEKIKGRGKKNG